MTVHRREIGWQNHLFPQGAVWKPDHRNLGENMSLCDRRSGAGARLTTLGRRTAAAIASGHPLGRSSAFLSVREAMTEVVGPNVYILVPPVSNQHAYWPNPRDCPHIFSARRRRAKNFGHFLENIYIK